MSKFGKILYGICTVVELGCIGGLAYIGLKRNQDAYEAGVRANHAEFKLACSELDGALKDCKIKILEQQIEELKGENVEE